jgi:UTP--glucose-1-phosphate uridylyltransferase
MPDRITTAVIAAAGQATRMWPASKVIPKELFPLGRITVLAHLVWELVDCGIERIVIVAAAHNRKFVAQLFDPSAPAPPKVAGDPVVRRFEDSLKRATFCVTEQTGTYGNGTPLRDAIAHVGVQPCIYAFGDDIVIGENASRSLLEIYERTGNPVMAAQQVTPERAPSFGILECERRDGIDFVKRLIEKPKPGETTSTLASFGRYVVTPAILERLGETRPGRDGEIWFVDAVNAYMKARGEVCARTLQAGKWYTVGDPQSYADAVVAATAEQAKLA